MHAQPIEGYESLPRAESSPRVILERPNRRSAS
jgi:hypothetical protein